MSRRERAVARICSGHVRVKVNGRVYLVKRPSRDDVYAASEVYQDVLSQSELEGLYTDDELYIFLLENGFWDEEKQKVLEQIPKDIEEFKLTLWKSVFKSEQKLKIKKLLGVAKEKLAEMSSERHAHDSLSCSGAASAARGRYLLGCGLHTSTGQKVYPTGDDFWASDSPLLDDVMSALAADQLADEEIRELARTDPWRSVWNANSAEQSLFGIPAADYSDEQRKLVSWTLLYDSVFKHPHCPGEAVLEDDDCLDGWLIAQRRERETASNKADGESLIGNEKIANSEQVFLVAQTLDDAKRIHDLNDAHGKAIIRQRSQVLAKKGSVSEAEMPDQKLKIVSQVK